MDRRSILLTAGIAATLPFAPSARAADEDSVEFLFVQAGAQVALKDGTLSLANANPHTLYFSDRPERIAGVVTTEEFVEHWATGTDSFKADPPNAVLVLHSTGKPVVSVVELSDAKLADGTLSYAVKVIDGHQEIEGGWSSLFIDMIGRPLTPLSFAGVARRSYRRRLIY